MIFFKTPVLLCVNGYSYMGGRMTAVAGMAANRDFRTWPIVL